MMIIEKLENFPPLKSPIVLTVGNFDGMHRGHCALLREAQTFSGEEGCIVVLTFRNHPSEVLKPEHPTPLLCTLPHKLRLLEQFGVGNVVLLPFTRYLAQHSAAAFVENVRQFIPFSHLVLGHDATLGRDRQGDHSTMQQLGMEWGFNVHYTEEYRYEGKPVSSSRIREALKVGDLALVEELLNRPFSIYETVSLDDNKSKQQGFPLGKANVSGLCLPPFGIYAVEASNEHKNMSGIASLSASPAGEEGDKALLNIHLIDPSDDWLNRPLDIRFKKFICPEVEFNHFEEVREQMKITL